MPDNHNHRVDAQGLSLGSLRTAAWLRHLLDHAERFASAAAASREAHIATAAYNTLARSNASARRGPTADDDLLNELLAALQGDGASADTSRAAAYGAFARTPTKRLLAIVDRYLPGSKAVFDGAYGIANACGFDDPETGWAALESIEFGIGHALATDSDVAEDAMRGPVRFDGPAAGRVIDRAIGCAWRADEKHIDAMTALAAFSATLATNAPITLAAYGGEHNGVAAAIRRERRDLASTEGLCAALAVCRLEWLTGAGSFWAYYLLAGVMIAAPDVVAAMAGRFHGDALNAWLDMILASPARSGIGGAGEAVLGRLAASMSFTSRRNPIVHTKRRSMR
ncbi:hypothetical protein [Burkholderia oklahomensis]|uniref:hypothetical protein n=1 Tax=Burkholderia oklahomensis TaxID=342113 RepID=UPI00016A90CD|nr:hypothetical protein [Burkholderia oklahomensis]AJX30649.1 hypothetical protein BG90_2368 [Burkholderia oklahomensis C6786]AOI45089.1 hypothetical protein WI23_04295 [Burkholderia oklahomensis C6786]KUY65778.1 hypothetical protein WI23_03710 [Burkholderia oklahomensis C6786]MBI0358862.1 hypothetical protein [Burkholderia oklahomensis]SUW57377.1 Uncharacterised protein [Burkholderia oklahomensis]